MALVDYTEMKDHILNPAYIPPVFHCRTCSQSNWVEIKQVYGEHLFVDPEIKVVLDSIPVCINTGYPRKTYFCNTGDRQRKDHRCATCKYGTDRIVAKRRPVNGVESVQELVQCRHSAVRKKGVYRTINCCCDHYRECKVVEDKHGKDR